MWSQINTKNLSSGKRNFLQKNFPDLNKWIHLVLRSAFEAKSLEYLHKQDSFQLFDTASFDEKNLVFVEEPFPYFSIQNAFVSKR